MPVNYRYGRCWGIENYQMTGIHSLPVIANAYLNGIRGFDTRLALEANGRIGYERYVRLFHGVFCRLGKL